MLQPPIHLKPISSVTKDHFYYFFKQVIGVGMIGVLSADAHIRAAQGRRGDKEHARKGIAQEKHTKLSSAISNSANMCNNKATINNIKSTISNKIVCIFYILLLLLCRSITLSKLRGDVV